MEVSNNDIITRWGRATLLQLKARIGSLGIKYSADSSMRKISVGYKKSSTEIKRIVFKMPRHAIFVHRGVGRGTSISQVGSTNRVAKEWFTPVIDQNIESLADEVAANTADILTNSVRI